MAVRVEWALIVILSVKTHLLSDVLDAFALKIGRRIRCRMRGGRDFGYMVNFAH